MTRVGIPGTVRWHRLAFLGMWDGVGWHSGIVGWHGLAFQDCGMAQAGIPRITAWHGLAFPGMQDGTGWNSWDHGVARAGIPRNRLAWHGLAFPGSQHGTGWHSRECPLTPGNNPGDSGRETLLGRGSGRGFGDTGTSRGAGGALGPIPVAGSGCCLPLEFSVHLGVLWGGLFQPPPSSHTWSFVPFGDRVGTMTPASSRGAISGCCGGTAGADPAVPPPCAPSPAPGPGPVGSSPATVVTLR